MPKYFVGELLEKSLYDLIKPFLDGKRSGMVSVGGKNAGEIHIEGGEVVHAKTGSMFGEEAFLSMMDWSSGKITFDWEITAKERTILVPTGDLVAKLEKREEDWKKVKEVVPSPSTAFKISTITKPGDIHLGVDEWKVLSLASGGRAVAEIARQLEWDLYKTSKTICDMVGNGLLERTGDIPGPTPSSTKRYVNGQFFPLIEVQLKKIMGPIAPIIIEDKLAELGETQDAFPEDRIGVLIDALSLEIPDASRRSEFTGLVKQGMSGTMKLKE